MECSKFEWRTNVKFLTKLNWESKQIIEALNTVYGNNGPKKSAVYKWIKRFKESRIECEDDHRSGRPSTSITEEKVAAVRSLLQEDRRITIGYIANAISISRGSANSILTDNLGLSKLSARWVPKALRQDQMDRRADLSLCLLNRFETNEDEFLSKIVTGDETWIYLFDPENKIQSKEWLPKGSDGPKKFKADRSAKKLMATVFWDSEGIILVDFLEERKTVTAVYYAKVLRKLKKALIQKRPGKVHRGILFHHDNAPAHSSALARDVLRNFRWQILPHPPYSPDLAPSDFFLFPKLKEHLKGTRFLSTGDAKTAALEWFRSKSSDFYKDGLKAWKHRLEKCIARNGSYVEK